MRTIRARLPHAQAPAFHYLISLLLCCFLLAAVFGAAALPAGGGTPSHITVAHASLVVAPRLPCPGSPLPC